MLGNLWQPMLIQYVLMDEAIKGWACEFSQAGLTTVLEMSE